MFIFTQSALHFVKILDISFLIPLSTHVIISNPHARFSYRPASLPSTFFDSTIGRGLKSGLLFCNRDVYPNATPAL